MAYVLLPGSGFESDIGTFVSWALQLGRDGPGNFYGTTSFADYPPGYLYVLWLVGGLGNVLAPLAHTDPGSAVTALIKVPSMLADIGVGAVLFFVVRSWRAPRRDAARLGLIAAGLYLFNPVTWYDSAIWGQTDAFGALVVLLTVAALVRGNSEGAAVLAVLAALVKPQFGVVAIPIVAIVLLRRHLLRPGSNPRHPVLLPARLRTRFETEDGLLRLFSSGVSALVVLLLLITPFSLDVPRFISQVLGAAAGYPWLSVNAYNAWALIGSGGAKPLALGGGWSSDTVALLGPLPGVLLGGLLLAIAFAVGVFRLAWTDDRRSIVVVTIFLALCFFMLPTRVHERYMFPIFALLPLLAVVDRRWLAAMVVLSAAAFINFHGVLTQELYATPNLEHLPFGDLFREPIGVFAAVVLFGAGFAFVCWELRPAAVLAPTPAEPETGPWSTMPVLGEERRGAPAAAALSAAAVSATATDGPDWPTQSSFLAGARRWLAPILDRPAARRDRSALLVSEGGGRLDRRDLGLVLIVFVTALLTRTYRLEVPYGPHFDEVYHARTAVEFLQDWRYGMPHSIYEYTHPHMAKYLMAVGIEALGNNRVTDTRELGASVVDAAVEQRWSPPGAPNTRNGDRLYVVTTEGLRVYDLATRAEVATLPGLYAAVALDQSAHVLYIADPTGAVSQLPTAQLDVGRLSAIGSQVPAAYPFTQIADLGGALNELQVIGGSLVAASDAGSLASVDLVSGELTGRTTIAGLSSILGIGTRSEVLVDPALVTDAAAAANTLAGILDSNVAAMQAAIEAAAAPQTVVAGDLSDKVDDVQAAIDEGRLPGFSMADGSAAALASTSGLTLVDAASLVVLRDLPTESPVGGMDLVAQGPDVPTIYAASGDKLLTVRLPTDGPAALGSSVPMPNAVSDVLWNTATTNVHALGRSQDGTAETIYVVEPRSNSVFADARLAFDPSVLVLDIQPDRPADDRDDILALSSTGQLATVDVGNNQYAYRFPGVIAGALMAVFIYLLARFLFARRGIALIVAALVLVDGMFFANARIAMNDSYVALFIVAALTLFVPLWLGRWRSRPAIAGGLLGVGVLLGLALASKWVGLYAIGGVALLILLRSALGRFIALMALIALTSVLGYIAISPATSAAQPQLNYTFLFLMVGLTVLFAVAMALRPMRMSTEELRLGVIAALLPGPVLLAYGLLKLSAGGPPPILGTFLTPARMTTIGAALTVVGVVVVVSIWLLGRRDIGPLARPGTAVIAHGEPQSAPPPRGWLRPGSGVLGLPWLLALGAVLLVPLAVYVISYVPWIELGNRWTTDFPAGHTGQTFLDLQKGMYDYHNNLRATHPASSPWWAWPLDLKPVWFEQRSYAAGTTAVIYDTGNLVSFWLAIPAVAFVAWQAWRRRSLPLSFIAIAIACLWLPWARIDRATFQYHIFTTLPFSFLALAYFLAELWHGPSRGTWLLARAGAAAAIIGAPLLWLLRLPLCGLAGTQSVYAASEVCGPLSRQLMLTDLQVVGLVLAIGGLVSAGVIVLLGLRGAAGPPRPPAWALLLPVSFSVALLGVAITAVGAGLPGNPVLQTQVRAEEPALVALLLLAVPAFFVLRASDPRKFVVGALGAAAIWFVAFYPNIASLPVPTALSQIHLGLLPTWNWSFQFAVNKDLASNVPLNWTGVSLLGVAVVALCLAAAYAARSWHAARYPSDDVSALPETG